MSRYGIPSKLTVAAIRYGVVWSDSDILEGCYGAHDPTRALILLSKRRNLTSDIAWDTLMHEVVHAACVQSGAGRWLKNEEHFAHTFSPAMTGALRSMGRIP